MVDKDLLDAARTLAKLAAAFANAKDVLEGAALAQGEVTGWAEKRDAAKKELDETKAAIAKAQAEEKARQDASHAAFEKKLTDLQDGWTLKIAKQEELFKETAKRTEQQAVALKTAMDAHAKRMAEMKAEAEGAAQAHQTKLDFWQSKIDGLKSELATLVRGNG